MAGLTFEVTSNTELDGKVVIELRISNSDFPKNSGAPPVGFECQMTYLDGSAPSAGFFTDSVCIPTNVDGECDIDEEKGGHYDHHDEEEGGPDDDSDEEEGSPLAFSDNDEVAGGHDDDSDEDEGDPRSDPEEGVHDGDSDEEEVDPDADKVERAGECAWLYWYDSRQQSDDDERPDGSCARAEGWYPYAPATHATMDRLWAQYLQNDYADLDTPVESGEHEYRIIFGTDKGVPKDPQLTKCSAIAFLGSKVEWCGWQTNVSFCTRRPIG
jgi:hypothetical protein